MLFLVTLLGCELIESITGEVDDRADTQAIEALESARDLVREAENSPGKRRVLRVIRQLKSEIDKDETWALSGNVFAAAVEKVADDGAITSTEAGVVEDAFQRIVENKGRPEPERRRRRFRTADDE